VMKGIDIIREIYKVTGRSQQKLKKAIVFLPRYIVVLLFLTQIAGFHYLILTLFTLELSSYGTTPLVLFR
jgi:hypothetical protein